MQGEAATSGTERGGEHIHAGHAVQFYEEEGYLIRALGRHVTAGLAAGEAVVVIAELEHGKKLRAELEAAGISVEEQERSGRMVIADTDEMLGRFMKGVAPDPALFEKNVGRLLEGLDRGGKPVRAFGEMVAVLLAQGNGEGAAKLERLWNELGKRVPLMLLCAYPMKQFAGEEDREMFERICAEHECVLPSEESLPALRAGEGHMVALLQQRARSLEAEAKRREGLEGEARNLLAAIVDSSDDAIISKSLQGIITSWNKGATRIFGYTPKEAIGRPIQMLFPPELLHEEDRILEKIRRGERVDHFETVRVRKDGTPVELSLTISPVRDASGKLIGASKIARDITDRRRSQEMLERQNARLGLLNEAAGHLLAAEEADEMARGIFAQVRGQLDADACFVFVMDEAINGLVPMMCTGTGARDVPGDMAHYAAALAEKVAGERHGVLANRIAESESPELAGLKQMGFRAAVCEPLPMGHRLLGTLCLASRSRESFAPDEVAFIRTLCHYVAVAYERVRLFKRLRVEDRRKDEFLATLAHELRNPLAPLASALELFRLGSVTPPMQDQLRDMMHQQLRQLTRLVDDLLEISRITSGKISLKREQADLAGVVHNAIDTSQPLIQKHRHELVASIAPEVMIVDADPMRLAQVFVNLLNNAAKYTEDGGRIELSVRREKGDAVVSVKDSGLGIPPEMLPQVFDMFAQVDRTLNRAQGGLGIGLALAKQLVELHGGRIEAHSEGPGKGSEFIVRLVCVDVLGTVPRRGPAQAGQPAARQRRVLIADDNREAAMSLSLLLQSFHHTTRVAFDGVQALEMAEEFRPDAIVMDIGMPRLDGYGAAKKLREKSWTRRCTLIALSGWGQEEDRRQAKAAGFDYHFTKPMDIDALITLLDAGPRMKEPAAKEEAGVKSGEAR